jgi:hypothetical protein
MKKSIFVVLLALAVGSMGTTASATPLPLTYGDAYYLGSYTPNPGNPADETNWVNILNDYAIGQVAVVDGRTYSRVGSTLSGSFPTAVFGDKKENVSFIDATGYSYVLAKYGGGNGQDPGMSLVWFLSAGFTGQVAPPARYDDNGLSHIDVFTRSTTVPDGGMTLMLLGGALVGLGALRRKLGA